MTDHLKTIRELLPALSLGSVTAYKAVKAALDALEQAMREPCAWQIRIGNSPDWSLTNDEESADYYGKRRGLKYEKRPLYLAAPPVQQAQAEAVPIDVTKIIDAAVSKFLGWRLPFDFAPDAGISYDRSYRDKWGLPIGTNLFTAQQAKYMFECCLRDALSELAAAPQPKEQSNGQQ